jgi:hypothetical protein
MADVGNKTTFVVDVNGKIHGVLGPNGPGYPPRSCANGAKILKINKLVATLSLRNCFGN